MTAITTSQATIIEGANALAIARERFPNLRANGILGRRLTGPPIDIKHVENALRFLRQCRRTKYLSVHSFDLRQAIGNVSLGAVIAAAVALGFDVALRNGVVAYVPHCMIAVSKRDVRRLQNDIDRGYSGFPDQP